MARKGGRGREDGGEGLLTARLAPDMFPLATQVRFACVQAYEGVARLRDAPLPDAVQTLLAEGRGAAEAPGTLADAQARIAETIAMVEGRRERCLRSIRRAPSHMRCRRA